MCIARGPLTVGFVDATKVSESCALMNVFMIWFGVGDLFDFLLRNVKKWLKWRVHEKCDAVECLHDGTMMWFHAFTISFQLVLAC